MRKMTMSDEMTSDRGECRRGHATPTPNELGKGQEEEEGMVSCGVREIIKEKHLSLSSMDVVKGD
jgi:hypothetical protein